MPHCNNPTRPCPQRKIETSSESLEMYLRVKTRRRDSRRRGMAVSAVTMAGCQPRLEPTPRLSTSELTRQRQRLAARPAVSAGWAEAQLVWRKKKKMQSQGAVRVSKPTMICPRLLPSGRTAWWWWWRGGGHATTTSNSNSPSSTIIHARRPCQRRGGAAWLPNKTGSASGRFRQTCPSHIPRGSGARCHAFWKACSAREGCDPTKRAAVGSGMRCCCAPAEGVDDTLVLAAAAARCLDFSCKSR